MNGHYKKTKLVFPTFMRPFLIIIGVLLVVTYFVQVTNPNVSQPTSAAQEKVNITLSPKIITAPVGATKTVNVLIQPVNPQKKISGFKLILNVSGAVTIDDIFPASSYPSGSSVGFQLISEDTNKVVYVFRLPDDSLPSSVKIPVKIKGTKKGTGTLSIPIGRSNVVGNVSGLRYDLGTLDTATFTFQ